MGDATETVIGCELTVGMCWLYSLGSASVKFKWTHNILRKEVQACLPDSQKDGLHPRHRNASKEHWAEPPRIQQPTLQPFSAPQLWLVRKVFLIVQIRNEVFHSEEERLLKDDNVA